MSSDEFVGSWFKHPQDAWFERIESEPGDAPYVSVVRRPGPLIARRISDSPSPISTDPIEFLCLRGHTIAWGRSRARIFIHKTDEKRVRGQIELLQLASTLIEFVAVQARRCGP